jgi:hypothetical protein
VKNVLKNNLTINNYKIGLNMKTYQELKAEARARSITVPFGTSKEQLLQLLNPVAQTPIEPEKVIKEEKPTETKEPSNSVPKDLQKLNLIPIRKMSAEDVRIDKASNYKRKLDVPSEIKEELEREGYKLLFPLDDEVSLNYHIRRGADFVQNLDGSSIRIPAQQSNVRGEAQYHIAMKIKKEILDEEARQQKAQALKMREKHRTGQGDLKSDIGASDSYVKFTNSNDNKI